jgi:hypothetical protein
MGKREKKSKRVEKRRKKVKKSGQHRNKAENTAVK